MKFKYTILYVDDVAKTLAFFAEAFGLEKKMIHEGGDYGELDTGQTTLAFSSKTLMQQLGKKPGDADVSKPVFEIAFETDNVQRDFDRACSAGAKRVQDPEEQPWGQTVSYVSIDDGFLVEICSPVRV